MRNATRIMVSTFGAWTGLAGIEHGIGEILQGNKAPEGLMILSWPESTFFSILGGEPAMTIIPNLLVTGILAIVFSLIYIAWATLFVQKKNGGLVMILLSIVMLLVGGGIFPPVFGVLMGIVGTRIDAPLTWWRSHLPAGWRHFLAKLWPWSLGACLAAWLGMLPGIPLLWHFGGVDNANLIWVLLISMFGFLFSTVVMGFAYDSQRQTGSQPASLMMNERRVLQVKSAREGMEPRNT